jgi:hypothetical protein
MRISSTKDRANLNAQDKRLEIIQRQLDGQLAYDVLISVKANCPDLLWQLKEHLHKKPRDRSNPDEPSTASKSPTMESHS